MLKKEPEDGEEQIIHIVFRLPNGNRIERKFYQNDLIKVILFFLFLSL